MDEPNQSHRSRIVSGVLFVFCAIPGLFLFLVFSTAMFGKFYDQNFNAPNPILSGVVATLGMAVMLIGVGRFKQWKYLFVFLSIPISLFGYILLDTHAAGGKLAPGIAVASIAFLTLYLVRRSYRGSGETEK
jgi:hypothetical protein